MLFFDTVTILEPVIATDQYGQSSPDWTQAATETDAEAELQPISSTEAVLTAGTVISRWSLWLDPAATLEPSWRVRYDGETYEVDGRVEKWKVNREIDHLHCLLKLVEG